MEKSQNSKLDKFYQGESNLNEEQSLAESIRKKEIRDAYLESIEELKTKQRLIQIEQQFLKDTASGGIKMIPFFTAISVAASLALILIMSQPGPSDQGLGYSSFIVKSDKKTLADLNQEEKLAYNDAKKALLTLSVKLNKAQNQMNKIRLINAKNPIKM